MTKFLNRFLEILINFLSFRGVLSFRGDLPSLRGSRSRALRELLEKDQNDRCPNDRGPNDR